MLLSRFPRLRFAHLPTPLEPLKRLSAELGGPNIWVKRDDCTGIAGGGNKLRKLEFLMAEAVAQGADTVITQGAVQSNHARQTAAVAAWLGLDCHVLLEQRVSGTDEEYDQGGNVLLDRLFGAKLSRFPAGTDMAAAMEDAAAQLRSVGRKPYVIPGGGSNPVGALGYVNAALELVSQANERGLRIDCLVHGTGSAGTQAGLVAGTVILRTGIPVLGISVRAERDTQEANVLKLARATAELAGHPGAVQPEDVVANADYVGEGYGVPASSTLEAISLVARTEGLLLDPVYSGKGMAGLIDLVRQGRFERGRNVVFLHTGGSTALFGYRHALEEWIAQAPSGPAA